MAERYANCTVSYEMHSDRRFDLLAELGGWTRNDACFRMVQLWARCTALQVDRPPAKEIQIHLGLHGERLLVDSALAERCPDGALRLLGGGLTGGDTDRFGWYEPMTRRGAAGGQTRRSAPRGPRGRFLAGSSEHQQVTSETTSETIKPPASYPQAPASGFRIPEEELTPERDPAVPSTTPQPGATTVPEALPPERPRRPGPEDRRAAREQIRAELERKRLEVGAKLGANARPLLAFDHGLDVDLQGHIATCRTWPELEQISKQALHAVAMSALEVELGLGDLQFLTGAVFSGRNFGRLVGATESTIRARARAGPRSSAARALTTGQPMIRPKYHDETG